MGLEKSSIGTGTTVSQSESRAKKSRHLTPSDLIRIPRGISFPHIILKLYTNYKSNNIQIDI